MARQPLLPEAAITQTSDTPITDTPITDTTIEAPSPACCRRWRCAVGRLRTRLFGRGRGGLPMSTLM